MVIASPMLLDLVRDVEICSVFHYINASSLL